MLQVNRSIAAHRRLILFKWLFVFLPPVIVAVGHSLLRYAVGSLGHPVIGYADTLLVTLLVLGIAYAYSETMFRVLRKLHAEALAREQDILTMNAVMHERERLSRELHDGVAQLVADLLLRLDTIKSLVEEGREHEAGAELEWLHGVADEIYKDIGESITGLRANVAERGLVRALQDYVDQFEERHQIPVTLRTDSAADHLPPLASFQIFRLIQEALTNVRKHAAAQEAMVTLTTDGSGQLKIVIADDGKGFVPRSERNGRVLALGLTSMRERVEALGGTFQLTSRPGSGTQVTAAIPLARTTGENGHAAPPTSAR